MGSTDKCASCKSADNYLRTLKSRKLNSKNDSTVGPSTSKKYEYMSTEELIVMSRKAAKELKYLRLKVDRLESKMTDIGPKSDTDLQYMFRKLYTGVEKTMEANPSSRVQNKI